MYRLTRIPDTIAVGPKVLLSLQSEYQSVQITDMTKYKVTLKIHSGAKYFYKECTLRKRFIQTQESNHIT